MNLIATRLKNVRKLLNKSQDDIAKELNVTKQAISNVENAKSAPSIQYLRKLLLDYSVNINYILSGSGDVFLKNDEMYNNLRKSLIREVEQLLDARGIK